MADAPQVISGNYELVDVESVEPHPQNTNEGDVGAVIESIEANGFWGACLVQRSTRRIIAGSHRWDAARQVGVAEIPVLWADVDDERALRIMLADNRTTRLGMDDPRSLEAILTDLSMTPRGLSGTGFDRDALDELIADIAQANPDDEVTEEPPVTEPPAKPVTRRGDLWILGDHRLLCGDCRAPDDVARVLEVPANLAFTSPPYAKQRYYDETSGFEPIPPDEYVDWFAPVAENVHQNLAPDGSWFVNIKPTAEGLDTQLYVLDLVLAHVRDWGWHFATEFCWERNGVPKHVVRRFKNQFEPVYQFARGSWKIRPDAVRHASDNAIMPIGEGAGRQGGSTFFKPEQVRPRPHGVRGGWGGKADGNDIQGTNWAPGEALGRGWAYPGNRLPTFIKTHEATGHPAAFPVGLPAWFVRAFTDGGDVVFDPFAGSGSTLIAAEREHRKGRGIEISPGYCDVIARRFQAATGIVPVRDDVEVSFTE